MIDAGNELGATVEAIKSQLETAVVELARATDDMAPGAAFQQANGAAWRVLAESVIPRMLSLLHQVSAEAKRLGASQEAFQVWASQIHGDLDVASASLDGLTDRQIATDRAIKALMKGSELSAVGLGAAPQEVAGQQTAASSAVSAGTTQASVAPESGDDAHGDLSRMAGRLAAGPSIAPDLFPDDGDLQSIYQAAFAHAAEFARSNHPPDTILDATVFEQYSSAIASYVSEQL